MEIKIGIPIGRGVMDESGEQFVAYFLPTDDTMVKRAEDMLKERDYDEEGEYEYKMFRCAAQPSELPILRGKVLNKVNIE